MAKVFLGAVVTYQAVYWLWVKLETDEMKDLKNGKREPVPLGLGFSSAWANAARRQNQEPRGGAEESEERAMTVAR